jgi:hypothetical protein
MAVVRVVVTPSSGQVPVSTPPAVQVAGVVTVHAPYWWVCVVPPPPPEQAANANVIVIAAIRASPIVGIFDVLRVFFILNTPLIDT